MKPTDRLENDLNNEIEKFIYPDSEEVVSFWDKNDAQIVLMKHNEEGKNVYQIIRGFFIGYKPVVSVDFEGEEERTITYLLKEVYKK